MCRYHGKCLKIARGKVKDEDKYTCPICDWRVKIPRDAARPKLEDLIAWSEKIPNLPFQPEEEEVLTQIIDNAQDFRNHIAGICSSIMSTESEADTQRFYLRKIEGAEILLAYETNFFRQELHKWCPVAPVPPPVLEVSKSTRKPRPTKLQKLLAQYGVEEIADLPEKERQKAISLRRKALNAEAAAQAAAVAAAASASGATVPPNSMNNVLHSMVGQGSRSQHSSATPPHASQGHGDRHRDSRQSTGSSSKDHTMDMDHHHQHQASLHPGMFMSNGASGPQLVNDMSAVSLEERLLSGRDDGLNLHDPHERSKALEILRRTELGRRRAEEMFGQREWSEELGMPKQQSSSGNAGGQGHHDEHAVNKMFDDLTNQADDDEGRKPKDPSDSFDPTAESLESERNGMDALLDGE